ncbi:MAG: alpha/beta hydrolase [Paludibacter sp.]|nr:alpha/beta hydrolase [Paludibacter sp.]
MRKLLISILLTGFCTLIFAQKVNYETKSNIQYYNTDINRSDNYIAESCILDVYYPTDIKGFPTVIWFHGGSLTGGNKEIPSALKEKGIGIVAVNYRLSPKVKVTQCIEDAAAAVSWTFNNIKNYGGDSTLIFVSGHSAGGYLTCMVGLDKSWLKKYDIDANWIAGLIPLSAQTITHFTARKERGIPDTQPIIDQLAPLYHVRPDAPPLLLITGDRELEMLGRYEENAYMMRMMKIAGHKATRLFELDDYGHGMTEPAFPLLLKEVQRITKDKKR